MRDPNGMDLEPYPEITPQLMPGEDPTGTAMNEPEALDPYLSERDRVLQLLTAFRSKRPGLLARISNAGGLAVPQGVVGKKGRTARLLLRGLLSGVNTLGKMKAQEHGADYNTMMAELKSRQGAVDDAEGRNKELARIQKDVNAELRAQRSDSFAEGRELRAQQKAAEEGDDSEYGEARTDAQRALAEQRRAAAARHNRYKQPAPGSRGGSGGKGGSTKKGENPAPARRAYFDGIADQMVENINSGLKDPKTGKVKVMAKREKAKAIAAIRAWQATQKRDIGLKDIEFREGKGSAPAMSEAPGVDDVLNDLEGTPR